MQPEHQPVPLPRRDVGESPAHLVAQVDQWLDSASLQELVAAFGGDVSQVADADRADWLADFAADHWDYRRGQERNLAQDADLSEKQQAVTLNAAQSLGLVASRPPSRDQYDAILILGGLIRACIVRPRYAAQLLQHNVHANKVVALGGFRKLQGDEIGMSQRLGVPGDNEFAAMTYGIETAFDRHPEWQTEGNQDRNPNGAWMVKTADEHAPTLQIIAAPSAEPHLRRANTTDTYRFYARRNPSTHKHLLVVTNPIYVPYQGCGAIQVLGLEHDWSVETVGADAASSDLGDDTQPFGPQQYLQEIRSAIYGMKSLRTAAETTGRPGRDHN